MASSYSELNTVSLTDTVGIVGPIGPAHSFDVSIFGTFVGTLVLQRYIGNGADGNWRTVKSYTGPIEDSPSVHVRKGLARIKFSNYVSGTAVVSLQATDAAMAPSPNNVVGIDPTQNTVQLAGGSVTATTTEKSTAAAPTYVEASSNPLSGDLAGNLRVAQADVRGAGTIASATPNAAYSVGLNNGEGVCAFSVTGLTASGATLAIEASDDGGTTWSAVNGIAPSAGILFSTLTTDQQFRVNTGGRTNVRLRVSATGTGSIAVASNASAVSSAVALSSPLPAGSNILGKVGIDPANGKATYTAWNDALDYTAYATPTDMVGLVNPAGSGKVLKVISTQFFPRATSSTTTGPLWQLLKRTTLNTGGTLAGAPAIMPLDSSDAAAVGQINIYTAAPTLGALAGIWIAFWQNFAAATTGPGNGTVSVGVNFPLQSLVAQQKYLTLRPGESLYWNFNGAAIPAGFSCGWTFQWTEE